MKQITYFLTLLWLATGWLKASTAQAQQIIREQAVMRAGAQLGAPSIAPSPDGGFVLTGGAFNSLVGGSGGVYSHLYITKLNAVGDTLWQRFLPQRPTESNRELVVADASGIWVLNADSMQDTSTPTGGNLGTRLWRLTRTGQVRRVIRPAYRLRGEYPVSLMPSANGDLYGLVYNALPPFGKKAPSILRFDSTGTLRWRHDYSFVPGNNGASLCHTRLGTVLLAGQMVVGPSQVVRLLEVETSRGDSVRGAFLPLAPTALGESLESRNNNPRESIPLTTGGYVLPSDLYLAPPAVQATSQLTRVDDNYQVMWRYMIPAGTSSLDLRQFTQVRELSDGTLLALARNPSVQGRTFWLYRFNGITGALLAIYPITSGLNSPGILASYLLPVPTDSTLLVVGQSGFTPNSSIYLARIRIPNLPRIVTGTASRRPALLAVSLGLPYPNPAQTRVTLPYALPPGRRGTARLELRDALGRLVQEKALPAPGRGEVEVDVSGLMPGLYAAALVFEGRPLATQRVAVVR